MDMKKITAITMLALLALPSLTMAMAQDTYTDGDENGTGLAVAIERARLYLDKVRNLAENIAGEYPENEIVQGYLAQIYSLLGHYEEEGSGILFHIEAHGAATAELSSDKSHSGSYSVHLKTTGTPGTGDEARIRIPMPEGTTLGEIASISWKYWLVEGYAPHVDLKVDTNGDGAVDDALVVEYAYNDAIGKHLDAGQPTYGCLTGGWYATFSDDGDGPGAVTGTSYAWPTTGPAGPFGDVCHQLSEWKSETGVTYGGKTIKGSTPVLALEFEVDNWMAQTEAYVDDIKINGDTYDFEEEEEEDGQAKYYLDQASKYLDEGDIRSAARALASARNILGRVNGLLTSMAKIHKIAKTEVFMRQVEHRIEGLEDKVEKLRGRLGEDKADNVKASMGLAKEKVLKLGKGLSEDNVNETVDELEITIETLDEELEELDEDGIIETIEATDRLEAKIRVLKSTLEKMERKGQNTTEVYKDLQSAEDMMSKIMDSLEEDETDEAEGLLGEAEEYVKSASDKIKGIKHPNKARKEHPVRKK